jgi:diacylglycerol kinase (ATP)
MLILRRPVSSSDVLAACRDYRALPGTVDKCEMSETVVIINPASGPGRAGIDERARYRTSLARTTLERLGVPHRIELTRARDHAAELARAAIAAKAPLVFAWGGDGTINEIASQLAFSDTTLAVIPGGSGNGFARGLGVSLNAARAIEQAVGGRDRMIDAGEIAGRLFFNVAGIGFDAHVARLFNERGLKRGFLAYITTSLIELFGYRGASYAIDIADETVRRDALMVVIANNSQYGNGARVAPHARPDDGHLDLVVVPIGSPLANVWRARRLFDGNVPRVPGVLLRDVETMRISNATPGGAASANGALWFHADGEVVKGMAPLDIRIHPHALRVRVPVP